MRSPDNPEDIPEGWVLGRESWSFHRQFYERVGRPTVHREYTTLLWQTRRNADQLARGLYRVSLADGQSIVVRVGVGKVCKSDRVQVLRSVLPADWTPSTADVARTPVAVAPPEPEPVQPKITKPLRGATLTLGNPLAARVLAERLRRMGVPSNIAAPAP